MEKKQIRSWAMYDWANSAFATTIMAAVLPIFYHDVAAKGLEDTMATAYWGYSQSIAVILVAVMAPILGAMADYAGSKKKFLGFFAGIGIIASMLLALVGEGDYLLASLLFILGAVGYSSANVFYDGFLPEIADKSRIDSISARGYAFGYIGGGILLLINLMMIMNYSWFGFADKTTGTQLSFVTVGIWWFLFTIPLLKNVKEPKRSRAVNEKKNYIKISFNRLATTFKEINQYKQLLKFLVAYWLFNDGIGTIIKMATIYGRDIGIGTTDLIAALVITQFVGIPCTFLFGWLTQKMTAKRALMLALWIYVGIVVLGYFMTTATHFYILAILVGFVQGGAHALSRSIFGRMVPENKNAEFFGFYGISAKFSAVLGPFVFALVGQLTGSSRLGIISVVIFFLAGIFLLRKVDIEKGQLEAERERTA
ncbi:MAG TPA: MFS transporter [Bacillales bacterium]|nr:MFS transporter [Bacillales bacterium]